jgi:hypothetical protein
MTDSAHDTVHVSALSLTPVKGTRLRRVDEIELGLTGARGDRAFYVVDERGRMRNGKQIGELQTISADYDIERGHLQLEFPDGRRVDGEVELGERIETRFFSLERAAQLVKGPFAEALSEYLGQPLRLVSPAVPCMDRGPLGAASLISRGSLRRLAEQAGSNGDLRDGDGGVDARRFRMLIEVDGTEPHGEDDWMGRPVTLGEARVLVRGNVGRCLVTSRDPESGVIDLPTLDLLGDYRRQPATTEPLPFGVHAEVLEPGRIRVGDRVSVAG